MATMMAGIKKRPGPSKSVVPAKAEVFFQRLGRNAVALFVDHKRYLFFVEEAADRFVLIHKGDQMILQKPSAGTPPILANAPETSTTVLRSQMPGLVTAVYARQNKPVQQGDTLLVVEAMKMQNPVRAPFSGMIRKIMVRPGMSVETGVPLIEIEPANK